MNKRLEPSLLLLLDFVTLNVAYGLYYVIRVQSGWVPIAANPDFWMPMVAMYLFWLVMFSVVGLYRPWYAASRFDELALIFKATVFGGLFLFFVIFVDDEGSPVGVSSRVLIAVYWGILIVCVSAGRMAIRSIQRSMLIAGVGVHNTLIVGNATRSRELFAQVLRYPALGYRVVGFGALARRRVGHVEQGIPVLGVIEELPAMIKQHQVKDVLIALDSANHARLLEIVGLCAPYKVGIKIIPDLYDIISGQARTNQIYGFPLIEITPQLMPPWEEATKRTIDIIVSALIMVVGFPIWVLVALLIKLDSAGPALYKQERVGKDGRRFKMIKFRSMVRDAESGGAQWADKRDSRVTRVGRVLRSLHLDEIPQVFNVLKGEMSLVGPRPERPVFVENLSKEIPLYSRRLNVRPGVTGWAQVKHKYDESVEDVRKKIEYDLYYIENMSLRMDFKILLSTVSHMLMWKGH